jgi:hypothetical protein
MATIPLHCSRLRDATLWCAMVMPPMANSSLAAARAGGKAARTRLPMPIHKLAARRLCTPTKNAAACVASPARLASLGQPCPVGSKKRSSASAFVYHPARPGPRGSHFYDAGVGRTVVVCAQKSQGGLDLDCPLPPDAAGGRLCGWGSEPARRASGCGRPFQRDIVKGIAEPPSGRPTRR